MAVETTLVLVKPDGVRRGLCGEIVARPTARLRAPRRASGQSRSRWRGHYAEHRGKPFYGGYVDFITSGPVLALAVAARN